MKYLTFLHSLVKRRQTFGNILTEESQSSWESQIYDEDIIEKDDAIDIFKKQSGSIDSIEFTNYEYLDETGILKIKFWLLLFYNCYMSKILGKVHLHGAIAHSHSQRPVLRGFPLFKRCEWLVSNECHPKMLMHTDLEDLMNSTIE